MHDGSRDVYFFDELSAAVDCAHKRGVRDAERRAEVAPGGADRLERVVDALEHLFGGPLQIDAGERGCDLARELAAGNPELRRELRREPPLGPWERPPRC